MAEAPKYKPRSKVASKSKQVSLKVVPVVTQFQETRSESLIYHISPHGLHVFSHRQLPAHDTVVVQFKEPLLCTPIQTLVAQCSELPVCGRIVKVLPVYFKLVLMPTPSTTAEAEALEVLFRFWNTRKSR